LGVLARHRQHFGPDEGPGREVQAGSAGGGIFAEEQFDRGFLGTNRVERGEGPDRHRRQPAEDHRIAGEERSAAGIAAAAAGAARAAALAAGQHPPLFLAALQQPVDVRYLAALAGTPAAAAAIVAAARASAAPPGSAAVAGHMFSAPL